MSQNSKEPKNATPKSTIEQSQQKEISKNPIPQKEVPNSDNTSKVDNEITNKTVLDNETYIKTIEFREKRIGIVFKVIYVVAALFATAFLDISPKYNRELDLRNVFSSCLAAYSLTLLASMVIYIFNEMSCMKLNSHDLSQKQIDITENSYTRIFLYAAVAGFIPFICFTLHEPIQKTINSKNIPYILAFSLLSWLVFSILRLAIPKINSKLIDVIYGMLSSAVLIFIFIAPAVSPV